MQDTYRLDQGEVVDEWYISHGLDYGPVANVKVRKETKFLEQCTVVASNIAQCNCSNLQLGSVAINVTLGTLTRL